MSDEARTAEEASHWLVRWLVPTFRRDQYVLYLIGCLLFSFGANFFIYAKLGTDPLDVFSLGLRRHLSFMTIGMAQGGFAALCLLVWSVWNRRLPLLSPFVTFFFCGTLIDIFMGEKIRHGVNVASLVPLSPWPLMVAGVFLCAYGSSLILMSGIGIRSMDLVAITMVQRWRVPFWACKGVLELVLLVTGYLLGGPLGWGTVLFLAFVGWLIQPLMWANGKLLRLPNYGLARAPATA
ncbi:MAG: hypothetical protein R3B70_13705 [Polyangiaceae bacterium]